MSKWMWIKSLFNLSSKARVAGTDLQGNVYSEEIGKGQAYIWRANHVTVFYRFATKKVC